MLYGQKFSKLQATSPMQFHRIYTPDKMINTARNWAGGATNFHGNGKKTVYKQAGSVSFAPGLQGQSISVNMLEIEVIEDLAHKKLTTVPESVLWKHNLRMLYLEGNALTELPAELFTCLDKLVWLDLRSNKLQSIPSTIMHHQHLQTILLQDNEIEKLPLELGFVPKLRVLNLSGNPLVYPTKEVVAQGVFDLKVFLRNEYKNRDQTKEQECAQPKALATVFKDSALTHQRETPGKGTVTMPVACLKTLAAQGPGFRQRKCQKPKLHIHKDSPYSNSNKYLHMLPKRKNELRIDQQYIKDLWMAALKEIMTKQDVALQKEKNRKATKDWRHSAKFRNQKKNVSYRPKVPFDYDAEYDRIPNRGELQIEQLRPLVTKRLHPVVKAKSINVKKLVCDIVASLKELEEERNSKKSPRTQMSHAGREIKRIVELQKRLSALKLTNDRAT